nr:aldo/keto reductase [Fulvivirga aurantia]
MEFSRIALGMWRIHNSSREELDKVIKTALDVGITSFDHADIYGGYICEETFGNWFKDQSIDRSQIQLISKCGIKLLTDNKPEHRVKHYDTSEAHIIKSAEESLGKLETEYLDLLLIHRPDPIMNPEEMASAFEKLKASGKVKHFGVSNFTHDQLDLLQQACDMPLVTNQIEISLFHNEPLFDGTLDNLLKRNIKPMAWSPLGGAENIKKLLAKPEVTNMADKYEIDAGGLLLSWLLEHPAGIVPVFGSMNPERIKQAPKALALEWDRQDWFILLEAARGKRVA